MKKPNNTKEFTALVVIKILKSMTSMSSDNLVIFILKIQNCLKLWIFCNSFITYMSIMIFELFN